MVFETAKLKKIISRATGLRGASGETVFPWFQDQQMLVTHPAFVHAKIIHLATILCFFPLTDFFHHRNFHRFINPHSGAAGLLNRDG